MTGLTNAVDAKTAVVDRLKAEADGGLLDGVSVDYGYNPQAGLESVYGGGWRMEQENTIAEQPGAAMYEVDTFSLYIRVVHRPPVDVKVTDDRGAAIAATIGRIFRNDPNLGGGLSWVGVARGQGDYSQTDDETTSIHAYQVSVSSFVAWGL